MDGVHDAQRLKELQSLDLIRKIMITQIKSTGRIFTDMSEQGGGTTMRNVIDFICFLLILREPEVYDD